MLDVPASSPERAPATQIAPRAPHTQPSVRERTATSSRLDLAPGANGAQKLRGGYYTPAPIAEFLASWAVRDPDGVVLEPSAGDGQLVLPALRHLTTGRVVAVEQDPHEVEKLRQRSGPGATVIVGDFFDWYRRCGVDGSFSAVIGNPPFIRYQDFPEMHRAPAFALMREAGLRPSRLTNAWLPFVAVATRALRPGGRLALVVPAELMQVGYAAEVREYLARSYGELTIITFRRLLFAGIEQETVLVLGIRSDRGPAQMSFLELDGPADLPHAPLEAHVPVEVDLDHAREKWTQFYLSSHELGLIRALERSGELGRLGQFASVDVGVVTGRNEFFVLTPSEAQYLGVADECVPLVGRSAQVPGLIFGEEDWRQLVHLEGRCYLLQLGNVDREALTPSARRYVEMGEAQRYHLGYKCAIRLPRWWQVPSTWVPDGFLLRQIHEGPRIIRNLSAATSTDTIHRVRIKAGVDANWLAAASVNSLTFAFSEIRGRSYGGGVLELEPSEAESLPFPYPMAASACQLEELDALVRSKGMAHVLPYVDRQTLAPIGLSATDIETLRGIWRKLLRRRHERKRR